MKLMNIQFILCVSVAVFAIFQSPLIAQTEAPSASTPSFEVASIKRNINPDPRWHMGLTPDGFTAVDETLQSVIREAYGVYNDQLWSGGPQWLNETRFDVEAKFDVSQYPNLTRAQRQVMLQQLLADRFRLVIHHETKEFPLYALVVTKNGPKLQEPKPEELQHSGLDGHVVCVQSRSSLPGGHAFRGCSMENLASNLRVIPDVGRTVVDKTGLTGNYTFELRWATEASSGSASLDASAPDIFTALQEQLGLKLEPTNGPLDTIVIDHVEMPSAN